MTWQRRHGTLALRAGWVIRLNSRIERFMEGSYQTLFGDRSNIAFVAGGFGSSR